MDKDKVSLLIKKYIDNTATPHEIEMLHTWYQSVNDEAGLLPYTDLQDEQYAKQLMFKKLTKQIKSQHKVSYPFKTRLYQIISIAAVLAVVFIVIKFSGLKQSVNQAKQLTSVTMYGERKLLQLTDGSKIWLSPGSTLNYPETFTGALREINLEGEAYFEIAKDKQHPFIIHTGNTLTRVLGTSFNIRAFKTQQDIEVALVEGKVSFSDRKTTVSLLPNNMVVYNKKAAKMAKTNFADVADVIARREGEYQYNNVKITEIAEDLERNFNVAITLKGDFANCTFFGRKKKDETIDKFLNRMSRVVGDGLHVTKTTSGYLIEGGGCK